MNTLSYKTVSVSKEAAREQKEWVVIDATDQVVQCTEGGIHW